jgi:hypothetical protein
MVRSKQRAWADERYVGVRWKSRGEPVVGVSRAVGFGYWNWSRQGFVIGWMCCVDCTCGIVGGCLSEDVVGVDM